VIPEIDIWRAAQLMLKRYANNPASSFRTLFTRSLKGTSVNPRVYGTSSIFATF
jgi:hypothetical protein